MRIEIHGRDLPGRSCHPRHVEHRYVNVHVGVQRRREVVELHPGDAASARWSFDADPVTRPDGSPDVRGPFLQGRPGERFVYLSWGTVAPDGAFTMFRRAKLMVDGVGPELLAAAGADGTLVGELGLTMADGTPLCAAVRPPLVTWSVRGGTAANVS